MPKILYNVFPLIAATLFAANFIFSGTIYVILGFCLILPYLLKYGHLIKKNTTIFFFVNMVFWGSLLNLPFTQNGIGGTINFIACIGLTLYCVNNLKQTGFLALILCVYLMLFVYKAVFLEMTDTNLIFESIGLSRNYPGFMMCILVSFWGTVKYYNYKSYPLLLPIFALFLCFFLEGRASLGIMCAICAVSLFYRGKKYILLFLLLVLIALFYYWQSIVDLFHISRFATEGMESSRSIIWISYIDALDLSSFIFGLDTQGDPILKSYGGNPHNAFLNFHSRMGFGGLLALIVLIVVSLVKLIKDKKYIISFYIILLIARFYFDACIGGTTDYLFYTMLFYPLLKSDNVAPVTVIKQPSKRKFINHIIELI